MSDKQFSPLAVDLFAGRGGISEGFTQSGFTVAGYLERDPWACETLRTRVIFHELKRMGKLDWFYRYVRGSTSREEILRTFPQIADLAEARVIIRTFGEDLYHARVISRLRIALKFQNACNVHVLLGGPPCQAYSLVGRSRDPDRMEDDERQFLYQHYLDVLADLQPDFFVLENVPGLLTAKTHGEQLLCFHLLFTTLRLCVKCFCSSRDYFTPSSASGRWPQELVYTRLLPLSTTNAPSPSFSPRGDGFGGLPEGRGSSHARVTYDAGRWARGQPAAEPAHLSC